jgi:hypothetical protein
VYGGRGHSVERGALAFIKLRCSGESARAGGSQQHSWLPFHAHPAADNHRK